MAAKGIFVELTAYVVSSLLPLVTAHVFTITFARTMARVSVDFGVQRRVTRAANNMRTHTQTHTTVLKKYTTLAKKKLRQPRIMT